MRIFTAGDCKAAVDVALIMGERGMIDYQQMAFFLNELAGVPDEIYEAGPVVRPGTGPEPLYRRGTVL
jgi:hypothetical protein